jgi:shikimate kinase
MEHLERDGIIVYLAISYDNMTARLNNITTRGVLLMDGESLHEMYQKRLPLYQKYATITVDTDGRDFESIVEEIADAVC